MDDSARVDRAAADVADSDNDLVCIIVESKVPLDRSDFSEDWKDIPVTLICPAFGRYRDLAKRFDVLRALDLRIHLPWTKENLIGLRILASLSIPCGVGLTEDEPDWDALADLMTYALLERVPHGPIEPFGYIGQHYKPADYTDWGSIYLDDPTQFLHLDAAGRVAKSPSDLLTGRFVAHDIEELERAGGLPSISAQRFSWREGVLAGTPCSSCRGWRICLGRLAVKGAERRGCSAFCAEMMDVVEQFQVNSRT